MGRPRAVNPAKNAIPVRFTDDELERLDRMRSSGESRSAFVRRLIAAAAADPSWALSASALPPPLDDLGPLEDEPAPSTPPPPSDTPTKALVRAVLAVLAPGGLEELRRAVDELLAERGR